MPVRFSLFDSLLLDNFSKASQTPNFDMRRIFDGALVTVKPLNAVTMVQNHDTQPGQAFDLPVQDYFKPLAYALILLRRDGYPCVFFGDLYGKNGPKKFPEVPCGGKLADLILVRKLYSYGLEQSYFDHPRCIGWVRLGTWDKRYGCAVVMSTGLASEKNMFVGTRHAHEIWTDIACSQPYADLWLVGSQAKTRQNWRGRFW